MNKKGIIIAGGLLAAVAVAGGTFSVFASNKSEQGIQGGAGESLALIVRVYEDIAKTRGYLVDVSRGASSGEITGAETSGDTFDMGQLLSDLNSAIDPDLHVDFTDPTNPQIDDIMTEALKQTAVYQYYEFSGKSALFKDTWQDLLNENLNTILQAYNGGDISKVDYYAWMNENTWPTSLAGKDAMQNVAIDVATKGYSEEAKREYLISLGIPVEEESTEAASNESGGSGGSGGGSSVQQKPSGGGASGGGSSSNVNGGGASGGGSSNGGGSQGGGAQGGYDTPSYQTPAANESWDGAPATEQGVADFAAQFGWGAQTDAEAANGEYNDHGDVVIH